MGKLVITEEHMKEGLSRAYTIAVAHRAGLNISLSSEFDYGIDGNFRDVKIFGNRRAETGYNIDFQLKATINAEVLDDCIKYTIEAKNYNDLVNENVGTPRILILLRVPSDKSEWLNISENETILKNCAWWCSLYGQEPTHNNSSKTIRIPRNQILDVDSLQKIMGKVKRGEAL